MNPLQYAVYKGTGGKFGAIQFNLQKPHFYYGKQKDFTGKEAFELADGKTRLKEGWKQREGCVFLEITSAKGKNVYDWDSKIILALSVTDMGKVLVGLSRAGEVEIMHDPGAKSESQGQVKKFLGIKTSEKGSLFSVTKMAGGDRVNHSVPLSPDEVVVLRNLLQCGVSTALSW